MGEVDYSRTKNRKIYESFLSDIKKSTTKRFVETGSANGDLCIDLYDYCNELLTCEVAQYLAGEIKRKYKNQKKDDKIKFFNLDSRRFLEQIDLYDTDIIFLDAHGGTNQPIVAELEIIASKGVKPIIYIDDCAERYDESKIVELIDDNREDGEVRLHIDNKSLLGWKVHGNIYKNRLEWNEDFVLDFESIKEAVEKIYGTSYELTYGETNCHVGWIRIKSL